MGTELDVALVRRALDGDAEICRGELKTYFIEEGFEHGEEDFAYDDCRSMLAFTQGRDNCDSVTVAAANSAQDNPAWPKYE